MAMISPRWGWGSTLRISILGAVALAAAACESLLVDPSLRTDVALTIVPASGNATIGDFTLGLGHVRYANVRLTRGGEHRQIEVSATASGDSVLLKLPLRAHEARGWVEIQVELRRLHGEPLFRGQGLIYSNAITSRGSIELEPVAHAVLFPTVPTITAIGDTVTLAGQALFAAGGFIQGASIHWESSNSSIAEIVEGNRLVSRANGSAQVTGSSLGAAHSVPVTVRQAAAFVTGLAPADTTVVRGATVRFRAFGEDANGFPLLPGASAGWSTTGPIAVDQTGLVTTSAATVGTVRVTVGTSTYSSQVTVTEHASPTVVIE